jgi:hypothetical protein
MKNAARGVAHRSTRRLPSQHATMPIAARDVSGHPARRMTTTTKKTTYI